MSAQYRFIPWVRSGLASSVAEIDSLGDGLPSHTQFQVKFKINQQHAVEQQLRLNAPGDIVAIDQEQIVRTEPADRTLNYEANYFPYVEFQRADFPWIFTPASGDSLARLRPWLVLIVVREQYGVEIKLNPNNRLPCITISAPAIPAHELPPLRDSWAWAHAQVIDGTGVSLEQALQSDSPLSTSRLLCPTKLKPESRYLACLVPAFKSGLKSGLGIALDEADNMLQPAWESGDAAPSEITLPIYYHWSFSTGIGGDFESLVRQLKGCPFPQNIKQPSISVNSLGYQLPDLGNLDIQGALRAPGSRLQNTVPFDFSKHLMQVLNKTNQSAEDSGQTLVVGPPLYASFQTLRHQLSSQNDSQGWLNELNLDPRFRASAGLGTQIIQEQQDELMASAWQQLDRLKQRKQKFDRAQLAAQLSMTIFQKRVSNLSPEKLAQFSAPAHKQIVYSTQKNILSVTSQFMLQNTSTVYSKFQDTELSDSIVSSLQRRILRARGPLAKRVEADKTKQVATPLQQKLMEKSISLVISKKAVLAGTGFMDLTRLRNRFKLIQMPILFFGRTIRGASDALKQACNDLESYVNSILPVQAGVKSATPNLQLLQQVLQARLDPQETQQSVTKQLQFNIFGEQNSDSHELSVQHPLFHQPMYHELKQHAPYWLLPGIENLKPDSVSLLETNPQFIESFMVGLNHEMSRELLWRDYPCDQRATYFNRFWDDGGSLNYLDYTEIKPIAQWTGATLGQNLGYSDMPGRLVLLIRGELLKRYPNTIISAIPADELGKTDSVEIQPIFRGNIDPDICFFGFNLSVQEAKGDGKNLGYYFVIMEPPTEPRFGLDAAKDFVVDPDALQNWNDLSWGHMANSTQSYTQMNHIDLNQTPLLGKTLQNTTWGKNAAHQARICIQRPVRIFIHANDLLTAASESKA